MARGDIEWSVAGHTKAHPTALEKGEERVVIPENAMRAKYDKELPRRLYNYFRSYDESGGAPSFVKFALANGITPDALQDFRKNKKFDLAYRAANEIRRDYLIDRALSRRFDPSFVKFLLGEEFGEKEEEDSTLEVILTVLDG